MPGLGEAFGPPTQPAGPLSRSYGYAFDAASVPVLGPLIERWRAMNRGELESQQAGREWFAAHPGARALAADAFTYAPLGLRPGVAGVMAADFLRASGTPRGIVGGRLLARNQLTDQRTFNPTDYRGNPGRSFRGQSAPANSPAGTAYRHRVGYEDALAQQNRLRLVPPPE